MFTTQDKLGTLVKRHAEYSQRLEEVGEEIAREAHALLSELQKIEGWECMIKACKTHYAKYPDKFFDWCSVTHTDDAVQFVKGYSNCDEYEVLEISFRKSLKQQVMECEETIEKETKKKESEIKRKELAELERLKKKYEFELEK